MRRAPPMSGFLTLVLAASASVFSACASGSGGSSASGSSRSSDLITEEELTDLVGFNAYDAVQRLRPRWLQPRPADVGGGGRVYPSVFVDRSDRGGLDALRELQVVEISSMRYIEARDATTLYGTGHPAGIIDIRTR